MSEIPAGVGEVFGDGETETVGDDVEVDGRGVVEEGA